MSDDERSGLDEHRGMDRGTLLRRLAVGGAALSVPTLAAAQSALAAPEAATANVFPKHPKWRFAFINHVTTNPFFVPTQYGAADAAKLTDQLSGGQQQRVSIARALMHQPAVVLADEPTGNLDSVTAQDITRLLVSAARERGSAVVLVTHDPAVARYADRTLVLHSGRAGWAAPDKRIGERVE